jgi:type III secretion protein Q
MRWLAGAGQVLLRADSPPLRTVPVPLALRFGWRRLAASTLRSLRVGDVLLLPHRGESAEAMDRAFLVAGEQGHSALGLPCSVRGRQITVEGDSWMNEQTMAASAPQDTESATEGAPGADPLAGIEIDLHLELQVLRTPIGELSNMRVGYVLELPLAAADACVDLVVGGRVFGRAQLVCVGDRLGARLIELDREPE